MIKEITIHSGNYEFHVEKLSDLRLFNLKVVDAVTFYETLTPGEVMERLSHDPDKAVKDLLHADKYINAVKCRRILTGEGLKEAKEYVDKLKLEMGL